jgi:hypothetical protein
MRSPSLAVHRAASLALASVLVGTGCNGTIATSAPPRPVAADRADDTAGTWRMIVLSGPTQVDVAPPASADSAAYRAELDQIKSAQAPSVIRCVRC